MDLKLVQAVSLVEPTGTLSRVVVHRLQAFHGMSKSGAWDVIRRGLRHGLLAKHRVGRDARLIPGHIRLR